MIDFLQVKNFKSLHNVGIKLAPLNLLMGLNSMGKSSLIQVLLLLRQSYYLSNHKIYEVNGKSQNETENKEEYGARFLTLILNGNLISLGNAKDVFYQNAEPDDDIFIFFTTTKETSIKLSYWYVQDRDFLQLKSSETVLSQKESFNEIPLFSDSFYFLTAEHIGPAKTYSTNNKYEKINTLGNRGEFAPYYLARKGNRSDVVNEALIHPKAKSSILAHQLDAWLSEISPGTKLTVEELQGLDSIKMNFKFETKNSYSELYAPINVGFGLPYVLPLILSLLTAKKGSLVLIENPESHLHPRGQSKLGELIALAAQSGVQIFCETHSDHIINGVRVAVKEKKLLNDNAALFYFDKSTENPLDTVITPIQLDKNGELDLYPSGLLDEWGNLMSKLF